MRQTAGELTQGASATPGAADQDRAFPHAEQGKARNKALASDVCDGECGCGNNILIQSVLSVGPKQQLEEVEW